MLIFAAQQAIPLMVRLAALGRSLEARGTIKVDYSESLASAALEHLQAAAQAA